MKRISVIPVIFFVVFSSACSGIAVNYVADKTCGGSSELFGANDVASVVNGSLPITLIALEGLNDRKPGHECVAAAIAEGYASYGFLALQAPDDLPKPSARFTNHYTEVSRTYGRGYRAAMGVLEKKYPGLTEALDNQNRDSLAKILPRFKKQDMSLLYWAFVNFSLQTDARLNIARTEGKDPEFANYGPIIDQYLDRLLQVDADFNEGALHNFYIVYKGGNRVSSDSKIKDSVANHYTRALQASGSTQLSYHLSFAENYLKPLIQRDKYAALLKQILATDVDSAKPKWRKNRLQNVAAQKTARILLEKFEKDPSAFEDQE